MRHRFLVALSTTALFISSVADARDVNMLRFEAPLSVQSDSAVDNSDIILTRSAALGSNPFVDAADPDSALTHSMRLALEEVGGNSSISNPLDAIDLDNLPTKNLSLPAWMTRAQTLPVVSSPLPTIAAAGCDGAVYQPTWWLSRSAEIRRAYYFPAMAAIACEVGLPTLLFDALIAQESGYNPAAISSAGAMGLAQIMPGTARYLGLNTPFDAISNMRAGARYLKEQLNRFGGRSDLALAAYNAGPGRVEKTWSVPRIRETMNYVNVITVNWSRLANLNDAASPEVDRGQLAAAVVDSFPYRRATFLNFSSR